MILERTEAPPFFVLRFSKSCKSKRNEGMDNLWAVNVRIFLCSLYRDNFFRIFASLFREMGEIFLFLILLFDRKYSFVLNFAQIWKEYVRHEWIVNRHVEREKRIQLVTKKKENIGHDSWLIRAVELSIRVVYETFNQFNDTARNWCLQRNMPIFDLEFAFDHSRLPCFLLLLPILRIIKLFSSMVPLCTVAIPTDRKIPHRNNV